MPVAEETLTSAALAGDREALGELLVRCDGELRRRMAEGIPRAYRSALDVADVLQVTYLEAFLRVDQFQPDGPGSFLAWLTASAENNLRVKPKARPVSEGRVSRLRRTGEGASDRA